MKRAQTDFDKKLGAAIRFARIKQKLSQTQLGEALGVTFQQIQKYENGSNAIASTRIPDLCRALKTNPADRLTLRRYGVTAANERLGGANITAARWA